MPFNPYQKFTAESLDELLRFGFPESAQLEYKRSLPEPGDKGNRDFVATVCAMANALGGVIIYGIDEERVNKQKTGRPGERVGVPTTDIADEKLRLLNTWASRAKPRSPAPEIYPVEVDGKSFLVVQVAKSWAGPHLVDLGDGRFIAQRRSDAGKVGMDWNELRTAFGLRDSVMERVASVRRARDERTAGGGAPCLGGQKPAYSLHVIPLASVASGEVFDLRPLAKIQTAAKPLGGRCHSVRMNFDGVLTMAGTPGGTAASTQLYRSGQVEAVTTGAFFVPPDRQNSLYRTLVTERDTIAALTHYFTILKALGVVPPVHVALSVVNSIDIKNTDRGDADVPRNRGFDRTICDYPGETVESFDEPADVVLRDDFDAIWQTLGFEGCPRYNADGRWIDDERP